MLSKKKVKKLYNKLGLDLKQKVPKVITVCPHGAAKSPNEEDFSKIWNN